MSTATVGENVLYGVLWAGLRLVQPFRKECPLTPHESETREYEWEGKLYCVTDAAHTNHLFIDWLPERVITAECSVCGHETEVR